MNSCNFLGNMTRDPELRYLPNNTPVCDFGLAINEKVKKNDEWVDQPVFLDCVAFGKSAENIDKYFHTGKQIALNCRARFEQWEDKKTGDKRSKVKFIVDRWHFTGTKSEEAGQHTQTSGTPGRKGTHEPVEESEIPF